MAPALRIPVSLDLDALRQQGQQASDHMGTVLRQIGKKFADVNGEMLGIAKDTATGMGLAWAQSSVGTIARFASMGAAGYAAFKLIEGAIGEAKRELADMVDLANKAQNVNLSPSAFQAFTAAAKGSQDQISSLESALQTFFQNSKATLDSSVSPDALDSEKAKWSDLETAIRQVRFELNVGGGTDTFLKATGTDTEIANQRLLGVVQTLKQLNDSGQRLVALDLAQKAFGGNFADDIRRGKLSFDEIAETVENRLVRGITDASSYSDAMVQRAKELDDELNAAYHTLSQNLQPTWESLEGLALSIKSIWVEIVELMAKAAGIIGRINITDLADIVSGPAGIARILARRAVDGVFGPPQTPPATSVSIDVPNAVPLPRRRPTNIPAASADSGSGDDVSAFDRTSDAINRHIAALNADAAAVGLNKTAHEAMRAEMQLLQAIQRDDGEVTQEQIDKYAELRATMSPQQALTAAGITLNEEHAETFTNLSNRIAEASAKLQGAQRSFQGVNDAARFFGNELSTQLSNINSSTKGIDLLRSSLRDLTNELIKAALTGEGAFAKLLGFASSTGGTGGIFGAIASLFLAEGGPVSAGHSYVVGEKGPEIFTPSSAGHIIPNGVAINAPSIVPNAISNGSMAPASDVAITQHFDFSNADPSSETRLRLMADQIKRDSVQASVAAVAHIQGSRPGILGKPK